MKSESQGSQPLASEGPETPLDDERDQRINATLAKFHARELTPEYCDANFLGLLSDTLSLRADLAAARSEVVRLGDELVTRCYDLYRVRGLESDLERVEDELAAARSLLSDAQQDSERLDWLESRLKDEAAWTDIVIAHDWEDGVWLSLVERGNYRGALALDRSETPSLGIRAAIDAARESLKPSESAPSAEDSTPDKS